VIYNVLPEEVLRYGEEHSFPIFLIEEGSWFENIIFEIMTAVEQDDARYLSEDLLRNMVHGTAAAATSSLPPLCTVTPTLSATDWPG
jgi:hypothetical protein